MPGTTYLPERLLIASAVVLTCVLFTREALDPVNVIKLTALLLLAIALVAVVAYRVVRTRTVTVPVSPAGIAAVALGIAFVISAVTAPVTTTAVVGAYGRNSGLLAYAAALVLFVVGLRVFTDRGARTLVGGVALAGLFTAIYGLLQKAGIDAIPWNNPFNPIIAALGNPNFASAYMGVAASVAAGGALWRGWASGWRIACAGTAFLCLFVPLLSEAVQGPIAAAGGLVVVAVGSLLGRTGPVRRGGLLAVAAATGIGVVGLLAAALLRIGPFVPFFTGISYDARLMYWKAALSMFQEHPWRGVGLDHFGVFWRTGRTEESVPVLGGESYTDAAHNVPLQMLAQGGLPLAVLYLAFVALVGGALVRGLRRTEGDQRLLLAALGGGWTAYQVQSLVSIDQVPLIVLHFALAGAVVAAAGGAALREVRLPGAAPLPAAVDPPVRRRKRTAPPVTVPQRSLTGLDRAGLALVAAVASVAALTALAPLRANTALAQAGGAMSRGDDRTALRLYEKAIDLTPGYPFHIVRKAEYYQRADRPRLAVRTYLEAARADPRDPNVLAAAASIEESLGNIDSARDLFRRAVPLDPLNRNLLIPAAAFELRHRGAVAARELMLAAVARVPGDAGLWATLGDAHYVLDDLAAARSAYERALEIDPNQGTALTGVDNLSRR